MVLTSNWLAMITQEVTKREFWYCFHLTPHNYVIRSSAFLATRSCTKSCPVMFDVKKEESPVLSHNTFSTMILLFSYNWGSRISSILAFPFVFAIVSTPCFSSCCRKINQELKLWLTKLVTLQMSSGYQLLKFWQVKVIW